MASLTLKRRAEVKRVVQILDANPSSGCRFKVRDGLKIPHTKTQPRTQDAQAQTVEKGIDSNDSQKSALGPRANAMTASSVSSS